MADLINTSRPEIPTTDDPRRPEGLELQLAMESAGMGSWNWDLRTGRIECSPHLVAIYGLRPEKFDGTPESFFKIVHPDDRDRLRRSVARIVTNEATDGVEYRVVSHDGSLRWIYARGRAYFDESGAATRIIGVSIDITDRKQSDEELRFQKALLQAQSDASLEGLLVVSPQQKILSFNRRFQEMWGLPREVLDTGSDAAVIGAVLGNLSNAEEFVSRVTYLYEHPEQSGHYEAQLKDGRVFACYGVPLRGSDSEYYGRMFHFRDVSEDRLSQRLRDERNGLRDAVKALEQVLGVVGHELRTPLAAVRALSEFMLENRAAHEQNEIFLKSVHNEVVRMSSMVNDLLEVARLNSGTAHWNWSELTVGDSCRQALDSVRPLIDEANVKLILNIDPASLRMHGDADAVRRLVLNLVSNACKHTHTGLIYVQGRALAMADARYVELEVADTGEGMTAETAARLGQAFSLNSGVIGENHVRGSGLGLAICRGIVAAHGGTLTVASQPRRGTTVTALLRADLPEPIKDSAEGGPIRTVIL